MSSCFSARRPPVVYSVDSHVDSQVHGLHCPSASCPAVRGLALQRRQDVGVGVHRHLAGVAERSILAHARAVDAALGRRLLVQRGEVTHLLAGGGRLTGVTSVTARCTCRGRSTLWAGWARPVDAVRLANPWMAVEACQP